MTSLNSVRRAATFIAVALGIYLLQWGKEFLVPLVVAMLLTDVLRPAVDWMKRRGLGNAVSVSLVTCAVAIVVLGGLLLMSKQVLNLTEELPNYQGNIIEKVRAIRSSTGAFKRIGDAMRNVSRELSPVEGDPATRPAKVTETGRPGAEAAAAATQPVPVKIIETQSAAVTATGYITPLLVPLANLGVIFTLLFFFLLEYDLMQYRIRWLLRQADAGVSPATSREASSRVGRYLATQLAVNTCSATLVATTLTLIGVPNGLLLGVMAGALRYIPYVGPLIGMTLPTLLAVAVFPGWAWPALVLASLMTIEFIIFMVAEPLLYGSRTGVSSSGVVVSFFFWGWIWGGVGLLLAMPITVWIVVAGRFLPGVRRLAVMLSDESVAAVEQAGDDQDDMLDDGKIPGWRD